MMGRAVGAAAVTAMGAAALVEAGAQPAAAAAAGPDANGDAVTAGNVTKAESATSVLYDGSSGFRGVVLLGNDSTYGGGSATFPAGVGGFGGAGSTAGKGGVAIGVYGYTHELRHSRDEQRTGRRLRRRPSPDSAHPGSGASHPKGGSRGDLYADKNGRLWFCKKGGTTATWHQIA